MSFKIQDTLSLAGLDLSTLTDEELSTMFRLTLNNGIHGICFSPYIGTQRPGSKITPQQIQDRLNILKPYTNCIRTFSCTEGNELVPKIAKENGFKTMVGAWIGKDPTLNRIEIENLIEIAKSGYADIVAVGNEVMYREDLEEPELVSLILEVKKALPEVPVGYVDAYYEFSKSPAITDACEILLVNCYPFWEGCSIDYSHVYLKNMYAEVKKVAKGKEIIITESGWPDAGSPQKDAQPSKRNAIRYFINTQQWAQEENIDLFYFSSFDEAWKISDEGDVGAHWGLWDTNGALKH